MDNKYALIIHGGAGAGSKKFFEEIKNIFPNLEQRYKKIFII